MTDEAVPAGVKNPPRVDSTLSKGLSILENLATSGSGKGVTELSRELGLTKSNTFRLLQTLTTLGYVKHGNSKNYAATLKTWQVGRQIIDNLNLRDLAAAEMTLLAQETGETIYLAVPENLSVTYIDKIDSQKPLRSWNPIGGNAPIHCVGTGKAIMAVNYSAMRDTVKQNLDRYTDRTITKVTDLDADMAITRERGFAIDTGEYRDRILSIGAAIVLPDGGAIAALGVSVPDVNLSPGCENVIGKLVAGAARRVSLKIGKGSS